MDDLATTKRVCDYCAGCGGTHPAEYSHESRFGEGPIYAVTCPVDGMTSYHTLRGTREVTA